MKRTPTVIEYKGYTYRLAAKTATPKTASLAQTLRARLDEVREEPASAEDE